MAELILKSNAGSKSDLGKRPMFDDFDKSVIHWSLSMSNSINQEDTLVIVFSGRPKYKNQEIYINTNVKIKFRNSEIDMIVRNIGPNLSVSQEATTVVFGTKKIYLDTFPMTNLSFEDKETISNFIDKIKKEADLDCSINLHDIGNEALPVIGQSSIRADQNLLDRIVSFLTNNDAASRYTVWLDAFNVLHVDVDYPEQNSVELDFNELGKMITSIDGDFQHKWEMKEVKDSLNPGKDEVRTVDSFEYRKERKTVEGKIKERIASSIGDLVSSKKKEKMVIKYGTWIIKICGLHLYPINSAVKLKNFKDISDEVHQLTNLIFNDDGKELYTQITVKSRDTKPARAK